MTLTTVGVILDGWLNIRSIRRRLLWWLKRLFWKAVHRVRQFSSGCETSHREQLMKVTALSSVKAINATHKRNIVALFLAVFCTSVLQVEAGAHERKECSVWTKKYLTGCSDFLLYRRRCNNYYISGSHNDCTVQKH